MSGTTLKSEPGDVFKYRDGESVRPAIYLALEDQAGQLVDQAEKVVREVAERLAPVTLPPAVVGENLSTDVCAEAWPPHFSTMRDRLWRVQSSLDEIKTLLDATGL